MLKCAEVMQQCIKGGLTLCPEDGKIKMSQIAMMVLSASRREQTAGLLFDDRGTSRTKSVMRKIMEVKV